MASYGWGTDRSVEEWLFEEGYRFDFYQAVRLLELLNPDKQPVGESAEPSDEVVRFTSALTLSFASGGVDDVQPASNGDAAHLRVNFMGLAGAGGPLPLPYTELVLERVARKDTAMRDFLDVFNHRLVSLMYRMRKLHRVGLDFRAPHQTQLARFLFALVGMGTGSLRNRMEIPDRSLIYYAGVISQQPRSMTALECIVSDMFGVKVSSRQLVGRWLHLEPDQTTALGSTGRNNRLGVSTIAGSKVWDQTGTFELCIGPVPYEQFLDMLPSGSAYKRLCSLVRFFAGDEYAYNFVLKVIPDSLPGTRLGSAADGARLGWTSWLTGRGTPEGAFEVKLLGRS